MLNIEIHKGKTLPVFDEQLCFDAGGHIFDTGGGDRYEGGNLDPLDEFSGEEEVGWYPES